MRRMKGDPLPLGVTIQGKKVNFSFAVSDEKECNLLLYRAGENCPCMTIDMEKSLGEVRTLALENLEFQQYEYNYLVDGTVVVDPYVKSVAGSEKWGSKRSLQNHEVRGRLFVENYDWEEDKPLNLPYHKVIAYSFHIRGFTKDSQSGVIHKGTFEGVIEKLPYLKELGINQIHCMPVYEFEESGEYNNYWGYGEGFFFSPKNAYSVDGNGVKSLKDMVRSCHKEGIEVVLEMPFCQNTSKQMMGDCLRYYVMEYHIDGFILNPYVASMDTIYSDPILKKTKIMKHQIDFQNDMRRFLKGDEGMIPGIMFWLRHTSSDEGIFNYIASHSGFTAYDLVSYNHKHNEENGEYNRDGTDYNFSWNCGEEGETDRKEVLHLRKNQLRNAFFLVLLAQGTPCIQAGDEFGNSQHGNNNVYCQDNPIGWVNWGNQEKELFEFVRKLIQLRKQYPVFYPEEEMQGTDITGSGVPDISYHGKNAWWVQADMTSRQLGVYYNGAAIQGEDCYVIYNMHWLEHEFALPNLPHKKSWYILASTEKGILERPELVKQQHSMKLEPRTIVVLTGR